jgi:hypothetical protein
MTRQLAASRDRWLRVIACCLAGVVCVTPAVLAADLLSGTWTSGEGATALTYVFKMSGDQFTGIVCGPCDNPATVFEVEDGRMVDAGRAVFFVRHEGNGRDRVEASIAPNALTLSLRAESNPKAVPVSRSLVRVVPNFELVPRPLPAPAVAPGPASASSFAQGRWVSAGRTAQQNWILKVRDGRIWGLVCGPCTPSVVTMIDGRLAGNTITFYINHIDTPPDAARQGIQRNVMTATIGAGVNANVMRFTWVREQSPDQSGEIVMFGPLR